MSPYVLVLFTSRHGATAKLARQIAQGIEESGVEARLRTLPENDTQGGDAAADGTLYCTVEDLRDCIGLALGSPTRFGHMSSAVHRFMEQTSNLWIGGALIDKPAAVFTSSSTLHGGQESTLLSMMLPLIHHGMLISGIPFSAEPLHSGTGGGSTYGAGHVAGDSGENPINRDERQLARIQGKRLGRLAQQLAQD
ncbi:MAG TPA: NAD(P)H:quinone oxidoreductase [Marinobacterium sp.]|nr:NAD(P)H:quinone oxidoreductase [Marinobacterium sp.]